MVRVQPYPTLAKNNCLMSSELHLIVSAISDVVAMVRIFAKPKPKPKPKPEPEPEPEPVPKPVPKPKPNPKPVPVPVPEPVPEQVLHPEVRDQLDRINREIRLMQYEAQLQKGIQLREKKKTCLFPFPWRK